MRHDPVGQPDTNGAWPPGGVSETLDLAGPVHTWTWAGPADAPTMLCLHGLGGSASNFGAVAGRWSATHRVVALDLLGHGLSRPGTHRSGAGAVQEQLALVDAYLATRSTGPVVLVGHSLGGVLAVLHAAARPALVDRLVLISPPVPGGTDRRRDLALTAKRAMLGMPGVRQVVDRQLRGMSPGALVARQVADATPHAHRVPDAALDASVEELRARVASDAAAARRTQWAAILGVVEVLARPRAWRDLMLGIEAPALWLQGEDDPKVPAADAALLAAEAVGSDRSARASWTFRTAAGVGHLPHLEDPTWTASTVEGWLATGD